MKAGTRALFAGLGCLGIAVGGCRSLPWVRMDLSGRQRAYLEAQSRTPADLGVDVSRSGEGRFRIRQVYRMSPDVRADARLKPTRAAGKLVIPIEINGVPMDALVDTGATFSMVEMSVARTCKLTPIGPELIELPSLTFSGIAGSVMAVANDMTIGGVRIESVPFGIMHRIPGLQGSDTDVRVVLGHDLLRQFGQVWFEYRHRRIRLLGTAAAESPSDASVLGRQPFAFTPSGLVKVEGRLNFGEAIEVVFDSGGGFGLWLPQTMARDLQLSGAAPPVEWQIATSLFRPSMSRPLWSSSLTIGKVTLGPLATYVGVIDGGDLEPAYAILGNHVFRRYSVALDYRASEILFLKP